MVQVAFPIRMSEACVACHNTHPDSPKHDWKVGDVRGIQAVTISHPVALNLFSFKYLLAYFACAALAGIGIRAAAAPAGAEDLGDEPRAQRTPTISSPPCR